jgi:SAM-dependent methyltransferase
LERRYCMVKLDIGCGKNKREGFIGVDQFPMENVDIVLDVVKDTWPWADGEVEEIHCSHFIEHLSAKDRVVFMNNAYRVLKPEGKITIIVPHWASNRAYGDFTHQWPPVSEMWFFYLNKDWRNANAPHTDKQWNPEGFDCHFEATWGYNLHQNISTRHAEHQQFAITWYKEAAQDTIATVIKK